VLVVLKSQHFVLFADAIGLWGIALPVGYVTGVTKNIGITGFLIALVLGAFISAMIMLLRFRKQVLRKHLQTASDII
jgi:Na+-driven multidrug efflux pump